MPKQRVQAVSARAAPIIEELEQWRGRALPDASAPLEADDVARLVRDCFAALSIDEDVARSFSVNTVYYYRRKDILDEPDGRTSAARYSLRHVWQAAGARLAGSLGLVTLAEARDEMRGATESALVGFLAERVADARGRAAMRMEAVPVRAVRESSPLASPLDDAGARPLRAASGVAAVSEPAASSIPPASRFTATVLPLGGDAVCLIPSSHAALRSDTAARSLVHALARALGIEP